LAHEYADQIYQLGCCNGLLFQPLLADFTSPLQLVTGLASGARNSKKTGRFRLLSLRFGPNLILYALPQASVLKPQYLCCPVHTIALGHLCSRDP
jgi:hypothetical protein